MEPIHFLFVGSNRLNLVCVLPYKIRGAGTPELEVKTQMWSNPDIKSEFVREVNSFRERTFDTRIELTEPISGEHEIRLEAHRPVIESRGRLHLDFPLPKANSIAPSVLVVAAADNVTLDFPDEDESGYAQDLLVDTMRIEALNLFRTTRPIRCFRLNTTQQRSPFLIDYAVWPQQVDLSITNWITLDSDSALVRQRFEFDVRYIRRSQFSFLVPRTIHEWFRRRSTSERLEIRIDGEIVSVDALRDSLAASDTDSSETSMLLRHPNDVLGPTVIEFEYTIKGPAYSLRIDQDLVFP